MGFKFKEDMEGQYRVKMRGKVKYTGKPLREVDNWKVGLDQESYDSGKEARARIEYHDGYRWEVCN